MTRILPDILKFLSQRHEKSISLFFFRPNGVDKNWLGWEKICKTGHHQAHWPLGRFPANAP
jgi:hypothetical protein